MIEKNPADILSKHCGMAKAWPLLQPLLFWKGDTGSILTKEEIVSLQIKGEYQDYNQILINLKENRLTG